MRLGAVEGGRILVVDRSDPQRGHTVGLLTQWGYQVREASSGYDAIDATRASGTDLVLLELDLPDIDGLDVIDRLRAEPRLETVVIIVFTARHDSRELAEALRRGAN